MLAVFKMTFPNVEGSRNKHWHAVVECQLVFGKDNLVMCVKSPLLCV